MLFSAIESATDKASTPAALVLNSVSPHDDSLRYALRPNQSPDRSSPTREASWSIERWIPSARTSMSLVVS